MGEGARRLEEALSARDSGDWATAYAVLSELRAAGALSADELYLMSDAAWWLGLIRETLALCEESHQRFVREGRLDRAAMVALEGGFSWLLRGEPTIASGWMSRARRLLAEQPTGLGHGFLLWMDGQTRFASGDIAGAIAAADQLQQLAGELDQPVLGCFGLTLRGMIRVRSGDLVGGFELLDEAMLPVLAGRLAPAEAGNLYCQMISVCTDLADVQRARRWTEITERWCDTFTNAVMFVGICRVHRAQLLRLGGDWAAAIAAAGKAAVELRELNVAAAAEGDYEVGEAHRLHGDLAEARSAYDRAGALGRIPQPGYSLLLLAENDPAGAMAAVRGALAEEADPFQRVRLLAAQVEIGCAVSDVATAGAAAEELGRVAGRYPSPGFRAWAELARARVLLVSGGPEEAVRLLRPVLATYRAMRAPVDEAMARALLGQALLAAGDQAAATPEIAAARDALVGMGLPHLVSEPVAPVPSSPRHLDGVTERELEVLSAVSEGLSNRQIGRRLAISEKTVARHLANVFLKLGVSSRTAAVAWLHRQRSQS